jgi:hypothetical protein
MVQKDRETERDAFTEPVRAQAAGCIGLIRTYAGEASDVNWEDAKSCPS